MKSYKSACGTGRKISVLAENVALEGIIALRAKSGGHSGDTSFEADFEGLSIVEKCLMVAYKSGVGYLEIKLTLQPQYRGKKGLSLFRKK